MRPTVAPRYATTCETRGRHTRSTSLSWLSSGDLGRGVTFGIARQRARLSGSTGSVELRIAAVAAWEDGLIHLDALYTDIDEARAAAERLAKDRG